MVWIIDNLAEAADLFGTVATNDPISAVLLALGAVIVAFSAGAFGVLTIGGILKLLVPDAATTRTRRQHT